MSYAIALNGVTPIDTLALDILLMEASIQDNTVDSESLSRVNDVLSQTILPSSAGHSGPPALFGAGGPMSFISFSFNSTPLSSLF